MKARLSQKLWAVGKGLAVRVKLGDEEEGSDSLQSEQKVRKNPRDRWQLNPFRKGAARW